MLARKLLCCSVLIVPLVWAFQPTISVRASGHPDEAEESVVQECKEEVVEAQLELADCTDRYAEELEEIREEFVLEEGLDANLCGLQGGAAGFFDRLCRGRAGFQEFIVIGFEAADVVDPPNALLVTSYSEQGFTVRTTELDPTSALSGVLGLDTTFFPNPGIQRVNQPPGVRVALPEDPIDDIVVSRVDGDVFRFLGGHFSFTNRLTQLRAATLTFEGYRDGDLVSVYSSDIVAQGALIVVQMDEGIDTLVIKDGDPSGWAYLDNLMFLHQVAGGPRAPSRAPVD